MVPYVEPPWEERKVYINGPGHITKMATTPIYGKIFKNLLLHNPISMKLGMEHYTLKLYRVNINDDPWLTLTYFTTISNLAKLVFVFKHCLDRTADHTFFETDHACVGSKHKLCRKVTTDCSLIIPIFVNGFDHNTKLHYLQSICFSSTCSWVHVRLNEGRLKETSRHAIAKLESLLLVYDKVCNLYTFTLK